MAWTIVIWILTEMEVLLSRWLTHMATGQRSQFLAVWTWHVSWLCLESAIQERETRRKAHAFYDLTSKVTHHPICLILFMRNKSLSLGHSQGDRSLALILARSIKVWKFGFRNLDLGVLDLVKSSIHCFINLLLYLILIFQSSFQFLLYILL